MSAPNTADFALIQMLTGGAYKVLCGIEGVQINRSAQMSERYVRDCAKPNRPGRRRLRTTGQSFSIAGSGVDNIDIEGDLAGAFGVRRTYRVNLFTNDGTDAGALLGSYAYNGILTARSQSYSQDASGAAEVTFEGQGRLIWNPGDLPSLPLTFSDGTPLAYSDGTYLELAA